LNAGWLGWLLSITGRADEAREQFRVALEMAKRRQKPMTFARVKLQELQLRRWIDPNDNFEIELRETRKLLSENDKEEMDVGSKERENATAVRLLASLARHQGRVEEAECMLHAGLAEAREFYLIQEEVAFRIDLAELFIPEARFEEAREQLDAVWVWVEFGPYRLLHSRAKLVDGDLLRAQGLTSNAADAVEEAYRLAWCDGPPNACAWCLNEARRRLDEWNVPIPKIDIAPGSAAEIVAATGPIFDDSDY
jgi:tetratricopeptide (TPR) repeat protein